MPGTSVMPTSRGGRRGLGPAVGGVVVGDRDDVEPGPRRPRAPARRGVGPVARTRVRVEVDAHAPSPRGAAVTSPGGVPRRAARPAAGRRRRRRAGSSRRGSSSSADAGRSTIHSHRPPASPASTDRSNSPSCALVETSQRLTDWLPIRTRADGGRSPISAPGSSYRVPAHRAPSPVPASSATTSTSTGPSELAGARRAGQRRRRPARRRSRPPRSRSSSSPGSSATAGTSGSRAPPGAPRSRRTTPPPGATAAGRPVVRARPVQHRRRAPHAARRERHGTTVEIRGRIVKRSSAAAPVTRARRRAPRGSRCRAGGAVLE